MSLKSRLFTAAMLFGAALPILAQEPAAEAPSSGQQFLESLTPQRGTVFLSNHLAKLNLNDRFYYLNEADSRRLLTEGWGNPPSAIDGVLGMIVPEDVSPLEEAGWGVVITYADDGHVSDSDADEINYSKLLTEMQGQTREANKERKDAGYPALDLVGWAESPHYDRASHKIYWAKNLKAEGASDNTLNYSVRVLGREGVLELNAIAGMKHLGTVRDDMSAVVGFAEFTEGNRYADFNSSTDRTAAYGLAALVAGGLAAKTGLFAKLGVLLFAAKKFIVVIFLAIGAFLKRLFGGGKSE